MRSRRLIGFMAILGVLLHAGFLVRHNASMLRSALQHQTLIADLSVICHDGGLAVSSDLPSLPQPAGNKGDCPICAGHLSAAAIPPSPQHVAGLLRRGADPLVQADRTIVLRMLQVRPPSRGPPTLA